MNRASNVWKDRLVWLGLAVVLGGLALLAYQGIYNRYWADDWCYDSDVMHRGLVGAVQGYYNVGTYASNRFSLTLFSGFLTPLWVPGVQALPAAVILMWLGGLFWNVRLASRLVQQNLDRKTSLLAAAMVLSFTLWLAPNEFQILMWRTGMLTYTAPTVGLTWLAGRILLQVLEPRRAWTGVLIAGLLAFLIGGFSEVGCTLLLSSAGLAFVVVLALRRWLPRNSQRAVPMLIVVLVTGIAAMVVLVLSPMNEPRRLASYSSLAPLVEIPFMVIKYAYFYGRAFLSLNRYAVLSLGASGLLFGLFSSPKGIGLRRLLIGLAATVAVFYLLVAAVNVPAAYIEHAGMSEPRALLIPGYLMVIGILAASWLLGSALYYWQPGLVHSRRPWAVGLMVLLALAPIIFSVSKYPAALEPIHFFQRRAQVWDERDAIIRRAVVDQKKTVDVPAIDSYASVLELTSPANWVNNCAATFYSMNDINATLAWIP